MPGVLLSRVSGALPDGIERLCDQSRIEGHHHITRLIADWNAGTLRFTGDHEMLLAAHSSGTLAGVGGITNDPHVPDTLRMRRFYVAPAWRGHGIARQLAETIIETAPRDREIVAHAPPTAIAFWTAMGFRPCTSAHHNMRLPRHDLQRP